MKKKSLFLSTLTFCVLANFCIVFTSCEKEKIVEKEVEVPVEIPTVGISEVVLPATASTTKITINPTQDWSVSDINESWLQVSPMSGDNTVRELTITTQANDLFDERNTSILIKFGETDVTQKIKQIGVAPFISIYDGKITFTNEVKSFEINPIVTNVELDIDNTTLPSWINDAVLEKVDEGLYKATIALKSGDYDSEIRKGLITFKQKNGEYTKEFPVECAATEVSKFTVIAPEQSPFYEAITYNFDVVSSPNSGRDTVLIFRSTPFGLDFCNFVKVEKSLINQQEVLNSSSYSVTFYGEYNDEWGDFFREVSIFVMDVEEAGDFDKNNPGDPSIKLTQKNSSLFYAVSSIIEAPEGTKVSEDPFYASVVSPLTACELTLNVSTNSQHCAGLRVVILSESADIYNLSNPFPSEKIVDWAKVEFVSSVQKGNEINYSYKLDFTQAAEARTGHMYIAGFDKSGKYLGDGWAIAVKEYAISQE